MPNNWQMVDTNFPTITGEEPVKEQISKIVDYLSILTEQLQYQLQNLDSSNWNASALTEMEDKTAERLSKLIKELQNKIDSLAGRISSAEGIAGRLTIMEEALDALILTMTPIAVYIQEKDGALVIGGEEKTVHLNGTVYINGVLQGEPTEPTNPTDPTEPVEPENPETPEEEESESEAT